MSTKLRLTLCMALASLLGGQAIGQQSARIERANRGLQVLFDFSGSGDTVRDHSGVGDPLNLRIENADAVRRTGDSLEVRGKTLIRSDQPPKRLMEAIKRTGEITIEAWVTPARIQQTGPARIVTLSPSTVQRNFTLGQDGDRYDIRFRSSSTDANGMPSLSSRSKTVTTKPTQVVYTREKSGITRVFVAGKEAGQGRADGNLGNWDSSSRLALANELTKDRPWLGTYHLVAIFDRAHTASEVETNYKAGLSTVATTGFAKTANPPAKPPPGKATSAGTAANARVGQGLQVLYDFLETDGNLIRDRSGVGNPINLKIADPQSVRRGAGALEFIGKGTQATADGASSRLAAAIKKSGEITIEAWLRPASGNQDGPARIVTLSKDPSNRNFTLGQDGNRYDVRLRATGTSTNGIPSTASPRASLSTNLTHVVYTRDRSGRTTIFLNGRPANKGDAKGATSNWDTSFRLALGDEYGGGRSWLGTYHLVAIYSRDLSPSEVQQNFKAGPRGSNLEAIAELKRDRREEVFITKVAPLISQHCLECHDTASRQGGLDLSRKITAFAGGDSGKVITADQASESLLWRSIEDDEMPHDRPPLSADEKMLVRVWIDNGAVWPLDFIDQAVYAHEGRSGELWVQRLTVGEYIATVRASVGIDIEAEARKLLPPDSRADGFNNTAYNLNVDLGHIDAYAKLAEIVAGRMDVVKFAGQFEKGRRLTDDNMRGLIAKMGKWLLRGPLNEQEVVLYRGISTTVASSGGSFEDAVRYVIEAMLQSPRFLYRLESQIGDGTAWPVGNFELASRLSYILWGAPPDKTLMAAAEGGDLSDPAIFAAQVRRMLEDPRAVTRSLEFVDQWLNLDRLDNLRPNRNKFPNWDPALAADMRAETLAFVREVLWKQQRPMSDLLNAKVTFLTSRLASHYGIQPRGGDGLSRYDLAAADRRGGLLTQGSVLTVGGDEASMVTRGLMVLHQLLRGVVKDPPPCVDTTPVPTKPGVTQRTLAESRIANQSCGGCHLKFEPLAFGLEKFDGLGSFHETDEHGNQLREDGEVLIPGDPEPTKYKTSAELMGLLAASGRVKESLTWKLTQFALGRPLTASDAPIVSEIHKTAQQQGGTYPALMFAILSSDLVQKTITQPQ